MNDMNPSDRLPLPSEDTGDLVEPPASGETDDPLVAREEGVPYSPPTESVRGEPVADEAGPDPAATADVTARAVEALRRSELAAGQRLSVGAIGSTVYLRGEVESVDVLDELLGILGDVEGVEDVVDETTLANR